MLADLHSATYVGEFNQSWKNVRIPTPMGTFVSAFIRPVVGVTVALGALGRLNRQALAIYLKTFQFHQQISHKPGQGDLEEVIQTGL